ncbi:nucleoside recognition family protein [Propionivibrio sp.]|uniref:nucleoside recognition family protein n=1 Tax=Propionivibrio sp. TaxID=2212460 RepID=UPI00261846A9|nr:nucleoside recognition family protein [Propionivibrio sp.]
MQEFLKILFASGQKGFELAFFILMPIMVFMMAIMRVLDQIGVLRRVAIVAAPILLLFGIPGLGVFAIVQILFVSFAAPASTFRIMDQDGGISDRKIAASFAAILCMSQANATLPLSAFGLNLPVTMGTSLLGGLVAAFLTYRVFARHLPDSLEKTNANEIKKIEKKQSLVQMILTGGEDGFQLVLKALPLLVLAVLLVNVLKAIGAIRFMEGLFGPVLLLVGISASAVLSIITKYIAGGTAMMGATIPMLQDHTMSAGDLNKIAGFMINTLDPVGMAVLVSAGKRFAAFAVPALKGALVGILVRGILHLCIF